MLTLRSCGWFALATLMLAAGMVPPAAAQVPQVPLADVLQPGATVWLTTDDTPERKGRVVDLDDASVTMAIDGQATRIARESVVRVRARHSDSILNGMLIGTGAAIGTGLALCRTTEPWRNCLSSTWPIIRIGLVGAGIGAGIDALIRPRRTVFEVDQATRISIAPVVGRQTAGAMLYVKWR